MQVRAKFECVSKTVTKDGCRIELLPVVGGSEENKSFFKWTPSGKVEMGVVNPAVAEAFVPGRCYYIDFTAAD